MACRAWRQLGERLSRITLSPPSAWRSRRAAQRHGAWGRGGAESAVRRAQSQRARAGTATPARTFCVASANSHPLPNVPGPKVRLKQLGQTPKHGMGQNFLLDGGVMMDIVAAADIQPGDRVLEIGPGTGVLTRGLLDAGALVTAIELDKGLATGLREQYEGCPQLEVIQADFMRWRKNEQQLLPDETKRYKVVANLPYNITSDALKRMLPMGDHISHLILMVQYEAAERLVSSSAGDGDYRPISVRVHFYSEPTFIRKVSKDFYLPPPAVDGAVISFKLRTRQQQPQLDSQAFFAFVGAAFTSKRKMLRNNLHGLGFDAAAVVAGLGELGLKETTRPNELEWGTYIELFHLLRKKKAAKHADEKMDEAAAVQASE